MWHPEPTFRPPGTVGHTIIFGADVTHGATNLGEPSIAGVVATADATFSKYFARKPSFHRRLRTILIDTHAEHRVQESRQEMIQDLKGMVSYLPQLMILLS